MKKMQIPFPEPQLARLRQAAKVMNRPVSELVCAAVDAWLAANTPAPRKVCEASPVYGLGEMQSPAETLRDRAWEDRIGS